MLLPLVESATLSSWASKDCELVNTSSEKVKEEKECVQKEENEEGGKEEEEEEEEEV